MTPKSSKKEKKKVNKDLIEQKKGKKFFESYKKIDKTKEYNLADAVKLLSDVSFSKFDGTCEIHLNLDADPKHADQIVRGTIVLPHGSGKSPKIAAFVPEEKAKAALSAGAHKAGLESLIEEVQNGKIDFDVAVAQPDVMKNIAKVAKILGQKGLMPNPKAGTITPDIEKAIEEIKKGKVEFKTDKLGLIHTIFGKISFGTDKLLENVTALVKAIIEAKPAGIKGTYIKTITICSTMSPGIKISVSETMTELR